MPLALVTGGTGFVGANIALRLVERRWKVRILERPGASHLLLEDGPFTYVQGDVNTPDSLIPAMHGVDVLFHAAGVVDFWRQGADQMYKVNVEGTHNVMSAALAAGVERVVHTSSTAAMGIHPNRMVDERFEFNVNPSRFVYGHSKHLAEQVVLEFVRRGLPAVIVNPTSVIGPRDVRKVSNSKIVEIVDHCAPPLIPPGGQNIVPICDVAAGHIEAATRGHPGERYILGGENLTLAQFYQTIADVVGCGMKLRPMPRWLVGLTAGLTDMFQPQSASPLPLTGARLRLEAQTFYFDSSKAREAFDMPKTSLRLTIGRAYQWYEEIGEFAGVRERLEREGMCKHCGRTRYCEWPGHAPTSALGERE